MTPARKGDGTGLSFNGYSQIRKGDGTVLWDAIPDSVVDNMDLLYWMDEGEGTTLNDHYGNLNASLINNSDWDTDVDSPTAKDNITTHPNGSDHAVTNSTFWINDDTASICVIFKPDTADHAHNVFGAVDSVGTVPDDGLQFQLNEEGGVPDDIQVNTRENGSNTFLFAGTWEVNEWQMFCISLDRNSDLEMWRYNESGLQDNFTNEDARGTGDKLLSIAAGFETDATGDVSVAMASQSKVSQTVWDGIYDDLF